MSVASSTQRGVSVYIQLGAERKGIKTSKPVNVLIFCTALHLVRSRRRARTRLGCLDQVSRVLGCTLHPGQGSSNYISAPVQEEAMGNAADAQLC